MTRLPSGRNPPLIISAGDPAGVGPEGTVKALAQSHMRNLGQIAVAGDPAHLRWTAVHLGLPTPENIEPAGDAGRVRPGQLSAYGGAAAVAAVRRAVELIQAGGYDALVTAPLNKEALQLAGFGWPRHTAMLARLTRSREVRHLAVPDA